MAQFPCITIKNDEVDLIVVSDDADQLATVCQLSEEFYLSNALTSEDILVFQIE